MKKGFSFLILLFTMILLSGCELVNEVIQNLNYQPIGENNVVIKARFQSTKLERDNVVMIYFNQEEAWIGLDNSNTQVFIVENEDDTTTIYDNYSGREDQIVFDGNIYTNEDIKRRFSAEFDFVYIPKVIDILNDMINKKELTLESTTSEDELLKDYKLYKFTLNYKDVIEDHPEVLEILHQYHYNNDDLSVFEDKSETFMVGLKGKQIKYLEYQAFETFYDEVYSFFIESVGEESVETFNEVKNLESFPKE